MYMDESKCFVVQNQVLIRRTSKCFVEKTKCFVIFSKCFVVFSKCYLVSDSSPSRKFGAKLALFPDV